MDPTEPSRIIGADWLIPMDQPGRIVRRGGVRVDGRGVIVAVGAIDDLAQAAPAGERVEFFESAVITPGLINAHTHLDLSGWRGRLTGRAGLPLHDWVLPIAIERAIRPIAEVAADARSGAVESLAAGVTTVVDVTPAWAGWCEVRNAVAQTAIRQIGLAEVLGFGRRGDEIWAEAEGMLEVPNAKCQVPNLQSEISDPQSPMPNAHVGLSPHAPYSTSGEIYRRCVAAARATGCMLMTHLSETAEEIEFCRTGGGPWRGRLEQFAGPIDDSVLQIPGCSPVEYVRRLGLLDHAPTLLAHVNYLCEGDMELLSAAAGKAAVVYCPRSADFFGHRDHPWQRMRQAGITVAVGTDSLASSPDLSILAELRFLHERHPEVPAEQLFAMATRDAAAAIGQAGWVGKITPGAAGDLAIWRTGCPDCSADAVLADVLESPLQSQPIGVRVGGREP
jgi:cytosine/adenosine deaminase-related metal-dependent hydrolase